jgi:hypothetical protein
MNDAFIVRPCNRPGPLHMLFLAAIARLTRLPDPESTDLLAQSRLGHLGLTVITLVYVLVTLWQQ